MCKINGKPFILWENSYNSNLLPISEFHFRFKFHKIGSFPQKPGMSHQFFFHVIKFCLPGNFHFLQNGKWKMEGKIYSFRFWQIFLKSWAESVANFLELFLSSCQEKLGEILLLGWFSTMSIDRRKCSLWKTFTISCIVSKRKRNAEERRGREKLNESEKKCGEENFVKKGRRKDFQSKQRLKTLNNSNKTHFDSQLK